MTTASQARQAVRSRMEAGSIVDSDGDAVPLRWQNEDADSAGNTELPDTPSPFVYTEFLNEGSAIAGYGGGRGSNLYRNRARIDAYVFVPKGAGLSEAELIAEQIAALFRSYRTAALSCFDATVMPGGDGAMLVPPGLDSVVGQYFWAAVTCRLHFDQVG